MQSGFANFMLQQDNRLQLLTCSMKLLISRRTSVRDAGVKEASTTLQAQMSCQLTFASFVQFVYSFIFLSKIPQSHDVQYQIKCKIQTENNNIEQIPARFDSMSRRVEFEQVSAGFHCLCLVLNISIIIIIKR